MNPRFILKCLLVLIGFQVQAQTGSYFMSHFAPSDERIDFRSMDLVQDAKGVIYFTNKAGVLEFDGLNWKLIPVPGAVYTLVSHQSEIIIGGNAGIGRLTTDLQQPRAYQALSATPGFFSSAQDSLNAYFCNEDQIIIYSWQKKAVTDTIKTTPDTGHFLGVFRVGPEVVVRSERKGLLQASKSLALSSSLALPNIIFSVPFGSGKKFLIGSDDNQVHIWVDGKLKQVVPEDNHFLADNLLVDGVWVSERSVALGTLRGGLLFLDVESGTTQEIINYGSGLPDNEVFALMTDLNNGVWAAHEYGFSRIAPTIPFRSYYHYPGLQGNLLCAQSFNGAVYVGTSVGLFQLQEEEVTSSTTIINPSPGSTRQSGFDVMKKGGKRKTQPHAAIGKPLARKAITYRYVRVNGIEGKVSQLTEVGGVLIASGIAGVFEVEGLSSRRIVFEPVRNVFLSPSLNQLLVSTFRDQVRTFRYEKKQWEETHLLDTLRGNVNYIFEDRLENIWLCGRTNIVKVEIADAEVTDIISMTIPNPMLAETAGLGYGNEVYVVASGQFFRYDRDRFIKYDSLPGARKYFASAGHFWFHDGLKWRTVDRRIQSLKLEWLGLFAHLRFLSLDSDSNELWVITAENELYKFIHSEEGQELLYPLFLREVRGQEIRLAQEVEVDQEQGSVTFEFVQPDYVGSNATQYRYLVKGLTNRWSAWSVSNNVINFSYLPAGTYQLAVQSRDLLGAESPVEEISFQVLPPYWKRWWFYALEFFIFSILVVLSVQLARSDSRYRVLSQILSLLTVIMLIQFIQTAIYSLIGINSSPVIEFFIQVCIALVVYPIENFARIAMMRAVKGNIQLKPVWEKGDERGLPG
jgi:hypothetical protein